MKIIESRIMNYCRTLVTNEVGAMLHSVIPRTLVLPIPMGPLRGERWVVVSGVLEYYLGCFEPHKVKLFERFVERGGVVYDVGAHVGYFSLLSARLVQNEGQVVAFEPNPENVRYLKRHIEMNGHSNIKVIEAALSNENGESCFDDDRENSTGRLSPAGRIKVKTLTIDALVGSRQVPPPGYLKVDVEGAEVLVLRGAESTIRKYTPLIFLATHGPALKRDCLDILGSLGYVVRPELGADIDEAKDLFAYPANP
jgi:FkbM family methyltransferase